MRSSAAAAASTSQALLSTGLVQIAGSSSQQQQQQQQQQHSTSNFTLRRMWVWVQDPLQRLSLLALVVDRARGAKGGALTSVVGAHLIHGDPLVQGIMRRIMRKTCRPLFDMISTWVSRGEISDPYSEFFIDDTLVSHWINCGLKDLHYEEE